ncbi:MAG: UbiD family decarboxylase [Anaerolineales bacterium]|nr:UbiD family decarboxylase [Anaerolineales bacterium]
MRDYIEAMLSSGQMQIVNKEVDPQFELAAVTARAQGESRRPILFNNVKGSSLPVVSNIFGDRDRLCDMIGAPRGQFCQHWAELLKGSGGELVVVPEADGEFYEARVADLPHITYHEKDAGPYITAGIFLANDPDTGVPNLSFHRGMHISDEEIRVRLGTTHDLTRYQARAEAKDQPLEVAILIGPPPLISLAAASPIPPEDSEMALVARLAGAPFRLHRCRHIDLAVPYDTEIVIEGRILPHVRRPEAPFGEFAGYYAPQGNNHVFEVLGVTVRRGAYYHALICGSPEDHRLLELALNNRVYNHLTATIPGILDVACVPNLFNTVVKIDKSYEGQPQQVILGTMGVHHDFVKSVMVVDADVDMNDLNDVYWAYLTRGPADSRVMVFPGVPGFYRGSKPQNWGRIGFDCTMPLDRRDEFERKRIPGVAGIDLADYLG